jgi:hypothetical protein
MTEIKLVKETYSQQVADLRAAPGSGGGHKNPDVKPITPPMSSIKPA